MGRSSVHARVNRSIRMLIAYKGDSMLTFDEAMGQVVAGAEKSILLGNGFSQSWDGTIFNYQNLFDQADFGARDTEIRNLFNRFGTYDFENVMHKMLSASDVLEVYGGDIAIIEQIRTDAAQLKEALITAIATTHPGRPYDVTQEQYRAVRTFLSQYTKIFTLNYDLLMYWARNQGGIEPFDFDTDDGFRLRNEWQGYGTEQQVFFLHGGLHIYDTSTTIKKHIYTDGGDSIVEQVRNNLRDNKFPLFVSEPTHEKKKTRISHNPYLDYCFRGLKDLGGALFIYGHSFDDSDKHVLDQIRLSHCDRAYVSVYGDEHSPSNLRTIANARTFLARPGLTIDFFSAESAPVWQTP